MRTYRLTYMVFSVRDAADEGHRSSMDVVAALEDAGVSDIKQIAVDPFNSNMNAQVTIRFRAEQAPEVAPLKPRASTDSWSLTTRRGNQWVAVG